MFYSTEYLANIVCGFTFGTDERFIPDFFNKDIKDLPYIIKNNIRVYTNCPDVLFKKGRYFNIVGKITSVIRRDKNSYFMTDSVCIKFIVHPVGIVYTSIIINGKEIDFTVNDLLSGIYVNLLIRYSRSRTHFLPLKRERVNIYKTFIDVDTGEILSEHMINDKQNVKPFQVDYIYLSRRISEVKKDDRIINVYYLDRKLKVLHKYSYDVYRLIEYLNDNFNSINVFISNVTFKYYIDYDYINELRSMGLNVL